MLQVATEQPSSYTRTRAFGPGPPSFWVQTVLRWAQGTEWLRPGHTWAAQTFQAQTREAWVLQMMIKLGFGTNTWVCASTFVQPLFKMDTAPFHTSNLYTCADKAGRNFPTFWDLTTELLFNTFICFPLCMGYWLDISLRYFSWDRDVSNVCCVTKLTFTRLVFFLGIWWAETGVLTS